MAERTFAVISGKGPGGAPVPVAVDADGNLGVSAGAGSATSALQQDQLDELAAIVAEVTGAAKDASVQDVEAAIVALGGGATIQTLASALSSDAATQATIVSRLEAIRDRLPAALVGGKLSVDTGLSAAGALATEDTLAARASEATADRAADAAETVATEGATRAKQDELKAEVDGVEESLASIDTKTATLESGRVPTNARMYLGATEASASRPVPTLKAPAGDAVRYTSFGSPISLIPGAGVRVRGFMARGSGTMVVVVALGFTTRTISIDGDEEWELQIHEITSVSGITEVTVFYEEVPT